MVVASAILFFSAVSTSFACPVEISDSQVVREKMSGYEISYVNGVRSLHSVRAYVGHPLGLLEQHPERISRSEIAWSFSGKDAIWVECRYENSAAIIRRNVGPVKNCLFKKKVSSRGSAILECK